MTADHGESLGEDDSWFAQGERIGEPLVHVPLMGRAPAVDPAAGGRPPCSTCSDLRRPAGNDPRSVRGRDLLSAELPREAVYISTLDTARVVRRGIVDGGFHYVRWEDSRRARKLSGSTADTTTAPRASPRRCTAFAAS